MEPWRSLQNGIESERTVKFHVSSLLTKVRVRGRMELVREATRHIPTEPSIRSEHSFAECLKSYSFTK
jgi:hypothetical protein